MLQFLVSHARFLHIETCGHFVRKRNERDDMDKIRRPRWRMARSVLQPCSPSENYLSGEFSFHFLSPLILQAFILFNGRIFVCDPPPAFYVCRDAVRRVRLSHLRPPPTLLCDSSSRLFRSTLGLHSHLYHRHQEEERNREKWLRSHRSDSSGCRRIVMTQLIKLGLLWMSSILFAYTYIIDCVRN